MEKTYEKQIAKSSEEVLRIMHKLYCKKSDSNIKVCKVVAFKRANKSFRILSILLILYHYHTKFIWKSKHAFRPHFNHYSTDGDLLDGWTQIPDVGPTYWIRLRLALVMFFLSVLLSQSFSLSFSHFFFFQ